MVFMADGNILHPSGDLKKSQGIDPKLFENIFENKFKDDIPEKKSNKNKKQREITSKNLSSLNSEDIKDRSWEEIKPCSKFGSADEVDLRSIKPSRSLGETDNGGTGLLVKLTDMTKNKMKNSSYTDSILNEAKRKRKEAEEKKFNRSAREDWEVVSGATKTSDHRGGAIGTARTAFEPAPLPDVKLKSVEKEISKNLKSQQAGVEAAKIKTELDQILWEKTQERFSGQNWEEDAYNEIHRKKNAEMQVNKESPNVAPQFTPMGKAKGTELDCTGIFAIPQDPKEFKEKTIKRNSDKLKEKRTRREDDRSWETLKNSKSKKY